MDVILIDGATRTIGAGQGYEGLPLRDQTTNCTVNGADTPEMVSEWAPTPKERNAIAGGATVLLHVLGTVHPPVRVETNMPSPNCFGAGEVCPFDCRLARTPYLVLPKLAIQAMPMDWRRRLEALLCEAEDTGMETPGYFVLRDEQTYTRTVLSDPEDEYSPAEEYHVMQTDPWANYRHGSIAEVCPSFRAQVAA